MRLPRKLLLTIILPVTLLITIGATIDAKKYRSSSPWIGVYSQAIDEDLQEAFDLDRNEGIVIVEVVDNSPADEAGLRRRDVILKFNNKAVMGKKGLLKLVRETDVGDEVELIVLRNGKERSLSVEIGDEGDYRRGSFSVAPSSGSLYRTFNHNLRPRTYIGVSIQNLNDQLGEYFGVSDGEGILITEIHEDSPAETAGLKAGDVLTHADGEELYKIGDLTEIISDKEEGDKLNLTILRRGQKKQITVEVTEDLYGMNSYGITPFGSSSFSVPNTSFNFVPLNELRGTYFSDDDDEYFDQKDYQKLMKKLQKEMRELQKQLQIIDKKLE